MRLRIAALAAVFALASAAGAQDRPLVRLDGPASDPLVARLERELVTAGFRVGPDAREDAPRLAVDADAVRLWMPGDGAPTSFAREGDEASIALAVVEALRVRGREPRPEAAPLVASPRRALAALALGAGVMGSPGGIEPFASLAVAGEVRVIEGLYVEAFGSFAIPESYLAQRMHVFTFWTSTFGAGLGYSLLADAEPIVLRGAVGLAATIARIDGDEDSWAATPYLRLVLGVAPIPEIVVRLDAFAGAALPELELRFRAGWRATYGLPVLAGTLAIEARLFDR